MANIYENSIPDARQDDSLVSLSRFRPRYRALTVEEVTLHDALKDKAAELEALFNGIKDGRYKALAVTSLEQSIMWIVKGLTE